MKNISLDDRLLFESTRKFRDDMKKELTLSKYNFPSSPSSDGYWHTYVYDPTKKSNRRQIKAKSLENLIEKVYSHEKHLNSKTFKQVFVLLQQEKLKYIKDPEKLLSVRNTVKVTEQHYSRYFGNTSFELKAIDEICKSDIEDLCFNTLRKLSMTKKSFLNMRSILKRVFEFAYEQYWIDDNPYARINFKKYDDMTVRPASLSKRVHSNEEYKRMLDYIHKYQDKKPYYMPPYALELQMLMGLRRGEIAPLEWDSIKHTKGGRVIEIYREQITVKKSDLNPRELFKVVEHTKTYVDREFPVTNDIDMFLQKLRRMQETYYPNSKYLFPDPNTETGIINNNVVYGFYSRMCKTLNIRICRDEKKGPHSFRRNGITKISNSPNGNLLIASILYGNSVESASKHYYSGIDLQQIRAILEG